MIAALLGGVQKFFEKSLPRLEREVDWDTYLTQLSPDDRENVGEVCGRLTGLSQTKKLPIAVMAVGSVLYKQYGAYRDVDLLLLPLLQKDVERAEAIFAVFISAQPEVIKAGDTNQSKEGRWGILGYELCRHWHLRFQRGKSVNLLIRTDFRRVTLRQQLKDEQSGKVLAKRPFAWKMVGD